VVTWKDQSGNGNDATAPSTGFEPTIYTGGALVKRKGRAALNTTSSGEYLEFSSQTYADDFCLINLQTLASTDFAYGGTSGNFAGYYRSAHGLRWRFSGVTCDATAINQITTEQYIGLVNRVGTNVNASFNGAALSVAGGTSGSMVLTTIMRGSGSQSAYVGDSQELIFYNDDKSTLDQASINSNIGDYFTQNTPLLDTYSGAAAAYSLRLLDSTYTGSAVEVYNGSSYADIGFNVFGELDTVALAAHCGSNNGFIRTWYDQSGNGNHATQATTAAMPKIYDGTTGVVTDPDTLKPSLNFIDSSSTNLNTQYTPPTGNLSIFALTHDDDSSDFGHILGNDSVGSASLGDVLLYNSIGDGKHNFYAHSGSAGFNIKGGTIGNANILTVINNGTATLYQDGATLGSNTMSTTYNSNTFTIGGGNGTSSARCFNGFIAEIVLYASDQSSNRTNIEDNINTFYNIY
jgi:hypothetical protein